MCKWRSGLAGLAVGTVAIIVSVIISVIILGRAEVYAQTPDPVPLEPAATVSATPRHPAAVARYKVTFTTPTELQSLVDTIVMTLDEDIGTPPFILPPAVQIRATALTGGGAGGDIGMPVEVTLDGHDDPLKPTTLTIYPGDMSRADGIQSIAAGAQVTVTLTRQAGIANPTEGGSFAWTVRTSKDPQPLAAAHPEPAVRQAFGEEKIPASAVDIVTGLLVNREVQLSHEVVHRGVEVTAIGQGYKNGTTLTFWRDANFNGRRDSGELDLCRTEVGGNDIGVCSFTVRNPPFVPGFGDCALTRAAGSGEEKPATCNFVNGVDGLNQTSTLVQKEGAANVEGADQTLELEGAALIGHGAGPGRRIQVQLTDFPAGELKAVDIGGVPADLSDQSTRTVPASGSLHFSVVLPDRAREGRQSLRVVVTRADNGEEYEVRSTVLVGRSALILATPEEVRPNQRISVSGNGFSGKATEGTEAAIASISIGGHPIDPSRINGGETVRVNDNGNWSASIDLPLNRATTTPGSRELRVIDRSGRDGTALVHIPARELTITPPWGRSGATAVVAGKNFPSKNDHGSGFNLLIVYAAGGRETFASAETDANGGFETEIRIPLAASLPSTNTVRVEFVDDDGIRVITLATHDVPGAVIVLSRSDGPPGTAVTVSGQGFKPYMPVTSVRVGAIEVTPAPAPYTDRNGNVALEVIIPGSDTGVQTVAALAGGITASAAFTVTLSAEADGGATSAAVAVANLGDRFLRSFHFDNNSKTWTFYDPEVADASDQTSFIAGESYWILIVENTEAILNGKTQNLTCLDGNCWNLVVW